MRFGAIFVLASTLALGCTSPTLPLPPPEAPSESAGTNPNTVVLVGAGATPGAFITIQNEDAQFTPAERSAGTLVDTQGSWTATLSAVKNDTLEITEIIGDQQSQTLDFVVLIN
jgi:hypothetical protein